jgi:hypothetical protein
MSCPECCRVRKSQGYSVVIDLTQSLCASCAEWKANQDFLASPEYQAWLVEWVKEHPAPSTFEITK